MKLPNNVLHDVFQVEIQVFSYATLGNRTIDTLKLWDVHYHWDEHMCWWCCSCMSALSRLCQQSYWVALHYTILYMSSVFQCSIVYTIRQTNCLQAIYVCVCVYSECMILCWFDNAKFVFRCIDIFKCEKYVGKFLVIFMQITKKHTSPEFAYECLSVCLSPETMFAVRNCIFACIINIIVSALSKLMNLH